MAQSNNLASIPSEATADYFNNYFTPAQVLLQDVDDTIIGFFEGVTGNKESARSLASALIFTSLAQGIDPMTTLAQFSRLKPNELNGYLTMFLNLNRVGTSLLGVNNAPSTNKYVVRTILL